MKNSLPIVAIAVACLAGASSVAQTRVAPAGSPLAGITPVEFEEFRVGLDDFMEVESADEGLGPAFNATSCAVCHNVPAIGGAGTIAEMRAGRRNERGEFEALDASGETLFHLFSVPTHACQAIVPEDANVFARRVPISLFGAGLIEAIADDTLRALEDPLDRNGDGVRGRAALITDVATGNQRVGRFGWKAQHATLLAFSADAYRNEMGITNALFPHEVAFGISAAKMRACDRFPDPEDIPDPRTRRRGIDNFASFMRFLAPIGREGVNDRVRSGEQLFSAIGCATCHVPSLETARSSNPVFDRQQLALFSDLLLHDVGTGDGIRQADAAPNEIRTPALWGLRFRRPLLHDGSAATAEDAIGRHRGEAELARRGFERLGDADRAALLAFMRSL
jgi:CxxC motif-containing protein (DUF1111 family)